MTKTEIILERLNLRIVRRRGSRGWIVCPFHATEKSSTFFVRTAGPKAGTYWCFSCHAKGNLISLAMQVRGCTRAEAKAFVKDAGQDWQPPKARARVVRRPVILIRQGFELPPGIVFDPLDKWDTLPQRYVAERGITAAEVDRYTIGYAVVGRLAGRIIFPVRNEEGRVVSYTARTFVDDEPRYMTPHESECPDQEVMFGEHLWPEERSDIVVTEGAIDALAVERVTGIPTGALGGSDVRPGHVISLGTWKRVIVMTDNDRPGHRAARVLASSLGRHVETVRACLPEGLDAAVLAMREPERLRREVERAIMWRETG